MESITTTTENFLEKLRAYQGVFPKSVTKNGITTAIIRNESPFIEEIHVRIV